MSAWGGSWGVSWGVTWAAGAEAPVLVAEPSTGGWAFYVRYEQEQIRRRKERKRQQEREEEAERIQDEIDREIARLLRIQEAEGARRAELARLSELVGRFADSKAEAAYGERVSKAFSRASAQQNISALMALEREIDRAIEEEDFLVLAMMIIEDN